MRAEMSVLKLLFGVPLNLNADRSCRKAGISDRGFSAVNWR